MNFLCIRFLVFFMLTMTTFSSIAKPSGAVLDRIIASVNSDAITESELNRQTQLLLVRLKNQDNPLPPMSELRKQILERLILEKVQLQKATEEGIKIDDNTLNKTINDIAKRDGLPLHQFCQFLEEQGVPFNEFQRTIKTELTLSKLQSQALGHQVTVSSADIDHFLNSPIGQDQTGAEYRLGHILIPLPEEAAQNQIKITEQKSKEIVNKLKTGGDFSQIAMAKSGGQQALNGGDLGFRKAAELPTLFAKIVPTLHVGDIYGPIRNSSGFHIIKLLDKRFGDQQNSLKLTKEAMRSKAMDILYQRKFDELLVSWLRRLREEAQVEIYLNESA